VKKKTTGYARGTKKAMPMRRKMRRKAIKESNQVEDKYEYRYWNLMRRTKQEKVSERRKRPYPTADENRQ